MRGKLNDRDHLINEFINLIGDGALYKDKRKLQILKIE